MRFRRKRELEHIEFNAEHPQFEPGTVVLINATPPGLEKYQVDWIAVEAEVVWNPEVSGTTSGVVVLVSQEECPLPLQDGYDSIELVVDAESLEVK